MTAPAKYIVLSTLALAKSFLMATIVFAITHSTAETLLITIVSACVTGMFLLVNTILQDRLMRRHTERIIEGQRELRVQVEESST